MSRGRPPELTLRASRATWWSGAEIALRYGLHFAVMMALARILRPADFGLLAMVVVITAIGALLVEGGLGTAMVQKRSTTSDEESSVLAAGLAAAVVLVVLLWLLAPLVAGFYGQPALAGLLRVMVWMLPLGALTVVPNALLSQRLDFRRRALAELFASLTGALLAVTLALRGHGVWSLAWQALSAAAVRAVLLWILAGWWPTGRVSWAALRPLLRFGGYLLLANLLAVFVIRLQSLLIGRYFDARQLGYYAMAQDTQQAPAQFMSSLLNRVGLPMFAQVADSPAKLAGALTLALRLSMFLFVPAMFGVAVLAQPLVRVLYGEQWLPAAPLLAVLALAATFWPLHVLNLAALGAIGRSGRVLVLEVAKAVVSIPPLLVAAAWGPMAVAFVVLATGLACVLINTWRAKPLVGVGLLDQLREVAPIFMVAAVAVYVAGWIGSHASSPLAVLSLTSMLGVSLYLAAAALLRMRAWCDLRAFASTLRHRPQRESVPQR